MLEFIDYEAIESMLQSFVCDFHYLLEMTIWVLVFLLNYVHEISSFNIIPFLYFYHIIEHIIGLIKN